MKQRTLDPDTKEKLLSILLPQLPHEAVAQRYLDAPGDEIGSGKFFSPQSSAALSANAFGLFLDHPSLLPPLPHVAPEGWRPTEVLPEAILRFPWRGGRHPCLDVVVRTPGSLVGIESKRYEPYTSRKHEAQSEAYLRDVWGRDMTGYRKAWQGYLDDDPPTRHLDVSQLVKHALAIRTCVHAEKGRDQGRKGTLYYLYADPPAWPDGSPVDPETRLAHRCELLAFADTVKDNEVSFVHATYGELLMAWRASGSEELARHAHAVSVWAGLAVA